MSSLLAPTGLDRSRQFVNGQWVEPLQPSQFTALEAATGEALGVSSEASEADIDRAVRAAHEALTSGPWRDTTVEERAAYLRRFADALEARGAETSEIVSRENGMPIGTSTAFHAVVTPLLARLSADMIEKTPFEEVVQGLAGEVLVRREPVGVVAAITPWNFPQTTALSKIGPALAAGNTVVLKPSPDSAFDSYVFADAALEAGFPPGVLNVLVGGPEAGKALVSHPLVSKVAFTGSTAAGRWIAEECGRRIRPVTLELGGKSAAIVCDDADLGTLYEQLGAATFLNNSQTCAAQTRILAPRSRYEEVVDTVAEFARNMVVGDPLDPSTVCGPMAGQRHLDKVLGYIDIARGAGSRIVTGGGRPAGLDRGYFVEPTVVADVDNGDRLAQEEVFGPVIAVIPFDDDADAIRIANDSNYGLGGSVWSSDPNRAMSIARQVRTGTIGINNYNVDLAAPFGGMKESGLGREYGLLGLEPYFEYKSIYLGAGQF